MNSLRLSSLGFCCACLLLLPLLPLGCGDSGSGPEEKTPDVSPPAAPSNLVATPVSTTQIDLTWSDNSSDETAFQVERSPDGSTAWVQIATKVTNTTAHSDTGLDPSTTYYYRVRANGAGGPSSYSATAQATTVTPPPLTPTDLVATAATHTQIDLTWTDNSSNESGFHVERSPDGSANWTELTVTLPDVTAFSDTGLEPETQYFYRVRANGTGGFSDYSSVRDAVTKQTPSVLTSVQISPDTVFSTSLGDQIQFSATGFDQRDEPMEGVNYSWESSDGQVATVTEQGLATVAAEGDVTISARNETVQGEASLLVRLPDQEFGGEPVTTITDEAGETVIVTESFGGRGIIVPVKDATGAPMDNASVEYAEAHGKPFVVVNGPGGVYVPTVFYAPADELAQGGVSSSAQVAPYGLERAVLEGSGKAISLPSELELLAEGELEGFPGFFEIKKMHWQMGAATFSGCYNYGEVAQEIKATRAGDHPDATFGLAFETADAGPDFKIKSGVMMGDGLFGMTDAELAGALLNLGQGYFGMGLDHSIEEPKVGVHFDYVDDSSAGLKLENAWVQYLVLPDDSRCQPDLVAGPLSITPNNPNSTDLITIQGSVSNIGGAPAGGTFSWRIEVDDQTVASGQENDLAAGGTLTAPIVATDLGPFGDGEYTVALSVSNDSNFIELSTANNTSSLSFNVSTPLGIGFGPEQFSLVPAGTFEMGDSTGSWADAWWGEGPNINEQPVHTVNITKDFYVQKTEVTQAQWTAVMGWNPTSYPTCGETCPVDNVTWYEVQDFISNLNAMYPGENFRLLTEAEWEYSCRAGTTGDVGGTGVLEEMGWVGSNSGNDLHPVAQKTPNAFGLYDMHGNLYEFVNDWWYPSYYQYSPTDDPPGPTEVYRGFNLAEITGKVRRGGFYGEEPVYTRCAWRTWNRVYGQWPTVGFRLAKTK